MVKLTASLEAFLWKFYKEELPLALLGHEEVVHAHWDEYITWCQTDEGKEYMKGGSKYHDPR